MSIAKAVSVTAITLLMEMGLIFGAKMICIYKASIPEEKTVKLITIEEQPTVYKEPIQTIQLKKPIVEEPTYPISEEEINLIALVTMAEVGTETELAKRLVIDTILNRVDNEYFPNTVHDVIYQPNQFSVIWNGMIDRCWVDADIVELVKEELLSRTNYECAFFTANNYGKYGTPLLQECCCYFSSFE